MKILEENLKQQVPVGAIFRHYKGKEYRICAIGRNSEDLSLHVVYEGLYTCPEFGKAPVWIRPLEMFLETVSYQNQLFPRFVFVSHE